MLKTLYICVAEQHDLRLVVLAAILCLFACFATVNLFIRAQESKPERQLLWLSAAATVFGSGVWATHFVAELAYRPGLPVSYDIVLTALSIVIAMAVSWVGLALALRHGAVALGGGIVGAAVCGMHYVGMAAVRVPAVVHWDAAFVILSLAIAVVVAAAALRVLGRQPTLRRSAAAGLLVLAIVGLHFTAMAAVTLEFDPTIVIPDAVLDPNLLAVVIAAVTGLILTLGISGALVDHHIALSTAREAEHLRRSQGHLARAQRVTHTGSIERDLRRGTVEWSDETYRIFGLQQRDAPPTHEEVVAIIHPEERARFEMLAAESAQGMTCPPLDFRIVRPDGALRWVHREAEVDRDESGRPVRWIGTFTDMTEAFEAERRQRALEEALRAAKEEAEAAAAAVQGANAALERRVEERTAELQAMQTELLKTERLSALGQITATVAHELNNPLGTIRNSMFAVRDLAAAAGAEVDRPIARMRRAIDRCSQIIVELLDFTTARELSCKPVRLDDWLDEVLDDQKLPAGIVLERRFGAPGVRVPIDLGRFRRVVANLIENGAEAIEEAAPAERRITVATAASDAVRILVEDTGPGMPPDVLAKVFEPLFSTKSFGTGLGLPTVKQIVQQHGGTVRVDSTVGTGTRVEICLPYGDGRRLAA